MKNIYIFAGGGTGGHLYPAVAIAQRLKELRPNCDIRFFGTARGLENRVIPELGFPLSRIVVRGVARSFTLKNLLVPFVLLASLLQCVFLLLKYRPRVVIGTGGYVSGPVLFSASLLGIPTLIQEQNSYPGATTRLLARLVKRVHISFAESRRYFKNKDKLFLTGNPVRKFDFSKTKPQVCENFGLSAEHPILLVFGGSQGAQVINTVLREVLDTLMTASLLQIIWSTGKNDVETVKKSAAKYGDRVWVSDFITDMEAAYFAADVALARAGALTLAELALAGLPAILVPYPHAAANHQETNARAFEAQNACIVIQQKDLNATKLTAEILSLLNDEKKRSDMSAAARKSAFPNATEDIVQAIFTIERGEMA